MKLYLLLFSILLPTLLFSQSDFKDVYKALSVDDKFSNMITLQKYQQQNPNHAIAYYLLAKIYNEYMCETDPLTMIDFINTNYNELKTNFQLAKFQLDEGQARRDRDYYGDIQITTDKRNVTLPDIIIDIDKRLGSAKEYYNNATGVHDNYTRCIEKYNQCLYSFRDILRLNAYYKDLSLMSDNELLKQVKDIASNFDSVLVFFQAYTVSCEKMAHLLKVYQYHLNPITTYRLEGLVEADFTAPIVELWDFKSWAGSFLKTHETDIVAIRDGLYREEEKQKQQINRLKNEETYGDEMVVYKTEDKFLNLIAKYDFSSIAKELLAYKNEKIDFLTMCRRTINDPSALNNEYFENRLLYYKELSFKKRELNDKADKLKQSGTMDAIGKYLGFFDSKYNGHDGFVRWCNVDKYDNDLILNTHLRKIQLFHERDISEYYYSDSIVKHANMNLSFGAQPILCDSIYSDTLITTANQQFKNKWNYLFGIRYDKKNNMSPFITRVDKAGRFSWFTDVKTSVNQNATIKIPVLNLIRDDSTTISLCHARNSNSDTLSGSNFLIGCNWKGEVFQQSLINDIGFPRYLHYDEINQQYLIITKGNSIVNVNNEIDTLSVILTDQNGNMVWKKQFLIKGSLVDVINTNSNFFIVCNAETFSFFDNNNVIESKIDAKGSIISIYINRDGKIKHGFEYSIDGGISATLSRKITSNLLTISGAVKDMNGKEDVFYLLTDSDGIPVFSNNEKLLHKPISFD
jgi:hypothetical protein